MREGLVRERQETSLSPTPPSLPLTFPYSSSSAIVLFTSFPISALSLVPPTKDPVIATTKEFCSSKDRDRIRHAVSTAGSSWYSEPGEKTQTPSRLWLSPWTAGINPRAAMDLLLFISRPNLSLASSNREQVWFTTTFSSAAKDYSSSRPEIFSLSQNNIFFLSFFTMHFLPLLFDVNAKTPIFFIKCRICQCEIWGKPAGSWFDMHGQDISLRD